MSWSPIALQRTPQQPSLTELTWSCMVCGEQRPDAQISVRKILYRRVGYAGNPAVDSRMVQLQVNVRYCNDRASCAGVTRTAEHWPPDVPVLQAGQVLQLTAAALAERAWETRDLTELAAGILRWLRDETDAVQTLLDSYDEPAQQIVDTCRSLVAVGLLRVVDDEPGGPLPSLA